MNMKPSVRFRSFFQPNSLRLQLLLRSFLILSVLLLLVGVFQYLFMRNFLYGSTAANMKNQIKYIPFQLSQQLQKKGTNRVEDPMLVFPFHNSSLTVAFVDTSGNVHDVFKNIVHDPIPNLTPATYQGAMAQDREDLNYLIAKDALGEKQLVVLQPLKIHGTLWGVAQVSTLVQPLQDILIRELLIYVVLAMAALVVGLFAYLPTLRRTLVPLSRIVDTMEVINAGNLNERLPTNQGQIEIIRLSTSFNNMLERLELSFQTEKEAKEHMRRFIADASHELRTPLTSIHGFLEILLRGAASNQEQLKRALVSMYGESERLNKLVQDLLLLAKMDRAPAVHLTEGELDQVVHEMEPQLKFLADERDVQFAIEKGIKCEFDKDAMKQVILNLFQNAVQHTHSIDGKIQIALQSVANGILLSVQDNGSGIPKEHVPHLFERFYRADVSRARKYGGAGLGLAITKSIVDFHGGSISVESEEGLGTKFKVWLPRIEKT